MSNKDRLDEIKLTTAERYCTTVSTCERNFTYWALQSIPDVSPDKAN